MLGQSLRRVARRPEGRPHEQRNAIYTRYLQRVAARRTTQVNTQSTEKNKSTEEISDCICRG